MVSRSLSVLLFAVVCVGLGRAAEVLELGVPYSDKSERCRVDVYLPEAGATGYDTVVWFHGGGLTTGERGIPKGLKGQGVALVAASYRLMPGSPIDACIEDAATAVAWTLRTLVARGAKPSRIFLGGHSAGAYLATMLVSDPKWLAAAGVPEFRPAGLLAISGQMVTHFELRRQRGLPATRIQSDEYAPFYFIHAGMPPVLLVTGDREKELYGRYEENAYYARMLHLAGNVRVELHELPGFDHGGVVEPAIPLMLAFMRGAGDERRK